MTGFAVVVSALQLVGAFERERYLSAITLLTLKVLGCSLQSRAAFRKCCNRSLLEAAVILSDNTQTVIHPTTEVE